MKAFQKVHCRSYTVGILTSNESGLNVAEYGFEEPLEYFSKILFFLSFDLVVLPDDDESLIAKLKLQNAPFLIFCTSFEDFQLIFTCVPGLFE